MPESEAGGNFDVKVSGDYTLTFNPETMQLSVEGEGVVDTAIPVFFMNSINGYNANSSTRMTAEEDGSYTYTLTNAGPDTDFKIMARIDGNDAWFGLGGDDGQNLSDGTYTFGKSSDNTNMTLENGGDEVNFTVKLIDNNTKIELTIAGQTPSDPNAFPPIYLVSSKIGNAAIEENRLTTEDGKTYTITKQNFSGDLPFHFFGKDEHQHRFSNGQQNMKNGTYTLPAGNTTGEMTLDNGGDVTFTFVLSDNHDSAELTISGQEEVVDQYPRMYLVGERTEWIATEPYRMQTEDGITYTLELDDMSTKPFRFTGDSWNVRSLGNGGVKLADGTYDLTKSETNMTLAKGGKVKYTLVQSDDFASAKLTIEGQGEVETSEFAKMYIVGSWATNWDDPIEMATTDGISYEVTVPGMTNLTQFKFYGGTWGTRELSGAGGGLANGECTLGPSSANMSLAIGGDVTFKLEMPEALTDPDIKTIASAKLTISGQIGEVPESQITYGLRGEFYNEGEWKDIAMTKDADNNVWSVTFTPTHGNGSFGVAKFINGMQPNDGGWFSAQITFNSETTSAELIGGGNCVFGLPANKEYTATYDPETNILTFSYEGGDDPIEDDEFTYAFWGQFEGTWAQFDFTKEEGSNVWTCTFVPLKEDAEFGIRKMKGEDQVAWISGPVTFNEENPSAELVGNGNCIFGFPIRKEYKATYNPTTNVLSFVATGNDPVIEYPEHLYIIGEVNGNTWNPAVGVELDNQGNGRYMKENVNISNGIYTKGEPMVGFFSFCTSLAKPDDITDTNSGWEYLGQRYGDANGDG
ncbi:MAG: hypothetical protein K2G23_01605, partial [Muribaculaceae bacterium]|nr:hypothetical protein [Muribaculaceae bacterium]